MRIKALSSTITNQIAAGEVIENPASVVKELLENALDAKASFISIDIGFGGLNQIKISDNGLGIVAEDLPLAIAPHATSKLTCLEDLTTLTSMGFRGEALASIASVSRLSLSSKPAKQESAMMLQVDNESVHLSPCARVQGTTVDVRDLFYNAPVRRRFLRSERSEYLAIEQIVKRFALSASHIGLVLKHNGKVIFELPAATCEQTKRLRIKKLLGKTFIEECFFIDVEHANMRLTGWVSSEHYQRSQNDKQWIYLNHRMIKDKLTLHAFKQAYENRLYPGRQPSCLLYLTIPSHEVDINVHPTKHEVRFQQPRLVHDFISSHIKEALSHVETLPIVFDEPEPQVHPTETMVIHENYIPKPLRAVNPTEMPVSPRPLTKTGPHWFVLNQQFGLMTWKNHCYLFNIGQAQRERHLSLLSQQTLPLASRPLLVPIFQLFSPEECLHLQALRHTLEQLGIQLDVEDTQIIIRTTPILFPQLNIKQLLAKILDTSLEKPELSHLLISAQSTDAFQLSSEERDALGHFIIEHLERNAEKQPWCLPLDLQRCQELMGV